MAPHWAPYSLTPECPKEEIERSLKNQLLLIINN